MEKTYGIESRHDQLIRFARTGKTILQWGYFEGEQDGEPTRYYYQHTFYVRPTSAQVVKFLTDFINQLTDEKILTGYVWNNMNVYLSSENQFNFKAAYDVAVQTGGAILPITFKLGEDADGVPHYYTFEDMATFADFYTGAIAFIQRTLAEGWVEKDLARQTFGTL